MNGFLPNAFNRTGRAGIMTDIGNGKELGASRTISLDQNHRDRYSDNKGNSNTNRGLRSSNISNKYNSKKDSRRSSSQDQNRRREVSDHRDASKDLRLSNQNTLSLKEDLKEGRENVESR